MCTLHHVYVFSVCIHSTPEVHSEITLDWWGLKKNKMGKSQRFGERMAFESKKNPVHQNLFGGGLGNWRLATAVEHPRRNVGGIHIDRS